MAQLLGVENINLELSSPNQQSQIIKMVAQWGNKAEIIEPKELRRKAKRYLLDTLELYYPGLLTDKFDLENLMPTSESIKPTY